MDAFATSQPPFDKMVDGILKLNAEGNILSADAAFCRLIGMSAQDLQGRQWTSLFHPFDLQNVQQGLLRFIERREAHLTVRCVSSDGTVTQVYLHLCEQTSDSGGEYFCLVLNLGRRIDYTTEKMQYQRLFEISNDLLCVANTMGYFVQVNPAFTHLLGYSREELLETSYLEFIHPDDINATLEELRNLRSGVNTLNFENRYRCKDGTWRWLSWSTPASNGDGLLYAVARDITEQKTLEEQLMRQAKFDFVSGLPTRTYLDDELIRGMARVSRTGQSLSLYLLQLEGLPRIIEQFGNEYGDDCVREFSLRLRQVLRASDFAARLGQTLFAIVTEHDKRDSARQLPQRIRQLMDTPLSSLTDHPVMTMRVGIALYDEHDERNPDELLQNAFADLQKRSEQADSPAPARTRTQEFI